MSRWGRACERRATIALPGEIALLRAELRLLREELAAHRASGSVATNLRRFPL